MCNVRCWRWFFGNEIPISLQEVEEKACQRADAAERTLKTFACLRHAEASASAEASRAAAAREEKLRGDILHLKVYLTQLNGFRKSTPPQNRQLIVYYY